MTKLVTDFTFQFILCKTMFHSQSLRDPQLLRTFIVLFKTKYLLSYVNKQLVVYLTL